MSTLASRQPVPDPATVKLKDPKDFVLIGQERLARKVTGKTDGTAIFTQDILLDGMLTAVVAHAPRFGGKVKSVKDGRARDLAGVVDVVQVPSGVAVLADDFWSAKKARDLLEIEWDETDAFKRSSAELFEEYRELTGSPGASARNDGDVDGALAAADRIVEATYEFPYLAHATMEPMNCVVRVNDGSCDIWNGAQLQTGDQALVAGALGIPMEKVHRQRHCSRAAQITVQRQPRFVSRRLRHRHRNGEYGIGAQP
jgi:isoquinoline 1-oxidoreductase beta subunit